MNEENPPVAPRRVLLLDYLMGMRDNMPRQLLLHMGEINIARMVAFIDGFRACQDVNGFHDEEYGRFSDWLRDVKQEFPTDGWDAKCLYDCDGDHERAIARFLGFVAEFVASRERGHRGG
ncbi:hypothetical protein [Melittangium boletus]|uniref:Uncharacterized protein n=1 Tax=Melittangium boletus DSM 14713 TaxID=1294270 RepID=A0A250IC27_9BACT|nr:hypothetical protein [Melittangium boletus]ATB29305.1 hypothetical protein MEBOL_002754 [Melittangium boletus DSM 14713]